jgi:anti-anti-sigma regulatory factor
MFAARLSSTAGTRTLQCSGKLFVGSGIEELLSIAMACRAEVLVLDLCELVAVDAAGVGAIVQITNWSDAGGRVLRLINLTEPIARVLHLFALDILLPIEKRKRAQDPCELRP